MFPELAEVLRMAKPENIVTVENIYKVIYGGNYDSE